jgi:polyisoprenyl-phosphate glycosyltransferase
MTPAAVARLAAMHELWIHLAACLLASRMRMAGCPLDRGRRYAGRSKLNFVSLALHGFRGLMVFAEDVLVRVGIACAMVAGFSLAGMAAAVVLKLIGLATPGWFSVALGILLVVLLQTGTLTLTMLMLTGLVRGGGVNVRSYKDLVVSIAHTSRNDD